MYNDKTTSVVCIDERDYSYCEDLFLIFIMIKFGMKLQLLKLVIIFLKYN